MFEYLAKVEKVIDGDTIDIAIDLGFSLHYKTRVRLAGIDTAEKNTDLGKRTKEYVKGILEGNSYRIQTTKPDKYGRILGELFLPDNSSFNKSLIAQGLAKAYGGGTKTVWTETELK
jgi:micrococcal nuclease